MTNRPIPIAVKVGTIPDALRAELRWVCWRYTWSQHESKKGRWIKLPLGKTNDPATWSTFDEAVASYSKSGFDGVGFCLGDGWAGVDLDHCRENDVYTAPGFIARLNCYLEVSPSGTGAKAIGRSNRIGGQIDFAVEPFAFTTWQGARFFAITGQGEGDPTVDISGLIDNWFPGVQRTSNVPGFIRGNDTRGTERITETDIYPQPTDDEALAAAATHANRDKFLKLFRGDCSDYGGDHSRADEALVCILAYWCRNDRDQIDRLFRQSALMRDKWDTRSYREATLTTALALNGGVR